MKKSFEFPLPAEGVDRKKVEIEINSESFTLADDLTGLELLEHIGNTGSNSPSIALGATRFLRRVVREEDWDRFSKTTAHLVPRDLGQLVGEVIDAYASFPTTPEAESSDGPSPTGSTPESG